MRSFFNAILYRPIYNLLIALVAVMPHHDLGLGILAITLVIRAILHPFTASAFRSQRLMQRIQPELKLLKEKHKDDQQAFAQATMKLYKDSKVSPFSSCLPLLLQLPVLIALYWVLRAGLQAIDPSLLYSFTPHPDAISPLAFGFISISKPSWVFAVLAGIMQFVQTYMLQRTQPPVNSAGAKDEAMLAAMNKQMLYVMPFLTIFIGWKLPAGLTIYWFFNTLLTVAQQWYIFGKLDKEETAKAQVIDVK